MKKKYDIKTTDVETLKKWYHLMTLGRALDEKAPSYLLQSLGWSYHAPYAGHDGIQLAVGQVFTLGEDFLFPYYRDMLTVLSAGMTAEEVILNGISKATDPGSGGRHMSNHFAKPEWHIENISSATGTHDLHAAGVASVNGEVVTELGTKIKRSDVVKFHDEPVSIERKVYVLLNKPKDTVTTSDDPQERRTVMDLVKGACNERIYPVGRLDRNTTGVLLLTNDGDLASKLTHPKFLKKKIYHVHLDKNLTKADMDQIAAGIQLEDGEIHADAISYTDDFKKDQVGIEIHSGKNRIVRRIFESLGYKVVKLDRVFFAGLTKKGLRRGDWRYLSEAEVNYLRMGSFE